MMTSPSNLPLFIREDVEFDPDDRPRLTEAEANLHFRQWVQREPGPRLGVFDEDDWVPVYHSELTFPNGQKFSVSNPGYHQVHDVGELVARYNLGATKYPWVEEWLKNGAAEWDQARRFYRVCRLREVVKQREEELRLAKITLNINTLEFVEGWRFSPEERRRLILEFGGTEQDA